VTKSFCRYHRRTTQSPFYCLTLLESLGKKNKDLYGIFREEDFAETIIDQTHKMVS
jgi:hypothetical protein